MGTDNFHHKRKREKIAKKEREIRDAKWLIVCEGEKTEPLYFEAFKSFLKTKIGKSFKIKIDVLGEGKNTVSLIDVAINVKNKSDIPYAKTFVVFDKDSFSNVNFNEAIHKCERNNMIPIWSNECFELWYLLHYLYTDSKINRTQYSDKLSDKMGMKYEKNNNGMFELLLPKLKSAYSRSKKLNDEWRESSKTYSNQKPNTNMCAFIDELVCELERFSSIDFWDVINS